MSRAQQTRQNDKTIRERPGRRLRVWGVAALAVLGIAAAALGCGWPGTDHSVRFNAYRSAKEFGQLPRLRSNDSTRDRLFSWAGGDGMTDEIEHSDSHSTQVDRLWQEALRTERDGSLATARIQFEAYLKATGGLRGESYDGATEYRQRRNSANDRLDALAALGEGAAESHVRAYLQARTSFDDGHFEVRLLETAAADVHLQDNAAYLRAAVTYACGDADAPAHAAAAFNALAVRYPRSEKREAALYMAALATLKQAQGPPARIEDGISFADCDGDCRELMDAAQAGFRRVMREYPRGRLAIDARGWIAHISFRLGDRAAAMAEYYRMLGDHTQAGRFIGLVSLSLIRDEASASEMERVEKLLESEPAAALAYAYHNIYNIALDSFDYRYPQPDRAAVDKHKADELKRVVAFATRMLNRYTRNAVGSGFIVRLAEADLELGNDAEAARLASRAVQNGARAALRAEALWVAGVALQRLHRLKEARASLTALVAENPDNRYTEGARRNLAIIAEDMADLDGALEQYLALDYRLDVAYFVDVLMTPEQLAAFIKQHPLLPHADELQYALGVRYLRDRRWNEARQTLMPIRPLNRGVDDNHSYRSDDQAQGSGKDWSWDPHIRGVRLEWIEQDLHTANDLERLEQQVSWAQGDEAKAEALYQVASYQYQGNLLFYNPAWQGMRSYHLYDLDSGGGFRRADEARLLFDYMQKHDCASSALPIYLEVVNRYPATRAARDALYTAAACHERLANYNEYWRAVYNRGGYAGQRMVSYQDVLRVYPDYHLPRGTSGWEPVTRTVNGRPAWPRPPKPPKPPPRPSRSRRAVNLLTGVVLTPIASAIHAALNAIAAIVQAIWKAVLWVCHWLWIGYLCFWLRFMWRRSREARRLVRDGLARAKPRPLEEKDESAPVNSITPQLWAMNQYLGQTGRDHFVRLGYDLLYKLRQMAMEKHERNALLLYAATHFLLLTVACKLLADW